MGRNKERATGQPGRDRVKEGQSERIDKATVARRRQMTMMMITMMMITMMMMETRERKEWRRKDEGAETGDGACRCINETTRRRERRGRGEERMRRGRREGTRQGGLSGG